MQFHDDDAVPDLDGSSAAEIRKGAQLMTEKLRNHGLLAEFVAPACGNTPLPSTVLSPPMIQSAAVRYRAEQKDS